MSNDTITNETEDLLIDSLYYDLTKYEEDNEFYYDAEREEAMAL